MSQEEIRAVLQKDGSWTCGDIKVPPCNALTAMLYVFRHTAEPAVKEYSFWEIAEILWNSDRERPLFEKHEWAETIVRDCCENNYTAHGGAAGSGKSYVLAGWGIVSWLCAPADTIVLATSTTLSASRGRIWGCIEKLLDAIDGVPCKLRSAIGSAAYVTPEGTLLETAGLRLIAAEKKATRDAVGKMIGYHSPRVIWIADELSELSLAIIEAGLTNAARNPHFEFRAASNPNQLFDAFGDWAAPKDGWDSVDLLNDYEWTTRYGGKYRRLDAERSPNFKYDYVKYDYLPSQKDIDDAHTNLGPTSRGYMRMFRAVFATGDDVDAIYSNAELLRSGSMTRVSLSHSEKVAGMDPAFTNGGDDTTLVFGEIGYDESGQFVAQPTEIITLFDDMTDKATPRSFQIAKQIKEQCEKRGVRPSNFAMDATGAGSPLADVVAAEWSPEILRVQFSGKASDRPVSAHRRNPAHELFTNRVSELWMAGKELVRCGQLRGIPGEIAEEMCGRTYDSVKGDHGLRMRVESKADYKQRLGRSPDKADAFFVLIELCRHRHGLLAMEPLKQNTDNPTPIRFRTVRSLDAISHTKHTELLDE